MRINIIAAVAANGVIGIDNRLPWRLPEDLAHFKRVTLGHPILMGRKTFESLGRPLPGRDNIVITRNPEYAPAGARTAASIEAALALCADAAEAFFIGGADLYAQALPLAHRMLLTEVKLAPEGDAHFPEFDRAAWRETSRQRHANATGLEYYFVVYERAPPPQPSPTSGGGSNR
jgi:dihydrofolate reductase